MYMTKESIINRLKEHYDIASNEELFRDIFAIQLRGSQNYVNDLFFKDSDVDSRVIILPTTRDIFLNIDTSQPELILDNSEHIDIIDIRKYLKLLQKPGINNYEGLFTEYYIVNPKYKEYYDQLMKIREDIVRINEKNFMMATMGLSSRDLQDLHNRTGGEDKDIEKYGYSRKRLANIIRFNETAKTYMNEKPFNDCLKAMDQELVRKIRKTEHYTLNEAIKIAKEIDNETYNLAKDYKPTETNKKTVTELEDIIIDLMIAGSWQC